MEHSRLVEKVLHEIAAARAGIAANYKRYWSENRPSADQREPDPSSDTAHENPGDSQPEGA
jgi:hypothetical protein